MTDLIEQGGLADLEVRVLGERGHQGLQEVEPVLDGATALLLGHGDLVVVQDPGVRSRVSYSQNIPLREYVLRFLM